VKDSSISGSQARQDKNTEDKLKEQRTMAYQALDLLERAIAGACQLQVQFFFVFCIYIYIMKNRCACHNFVGQSY
jgi:hypothetical protein